MLREDKKRLCLRRLRLWSAGYFRPRRSPTSSQNAKTVDEALASYKYNIHTISRIPHPSTYSSFTIRRPRPHYLPSSLHSSNKSPTPHPTHHHASHNHHIPHVHSPYIDIAQPVSSLGIASARTSCTTPSRWRK